MGRCATTTGTQRDRVDQEEAHYGVFARDSEHKLRRVPVVKQGLLVGMIGLGDLIREASAGGVRGTLTAPGLLKTLESVYEQRSTAAAAQ